MSDAELMQSSVGCTGAEIGGEGWIWCRVICRGTPDITIVGNHPAFNTSLIPRSWPLAVNVWALTIWLNLSVENGDRKHKAKS